jgi:hypothetical protein
MVANDTASYWRCKGVTPVTDKNSTPDPVDDHGYISGMWQKIPQTAEGGLEPRATATASPLSRARDYDPNLAWQTRQGALLCTNYFAMKEAKAAITAGDTSWLDKTGCIQAAGGLRVVLIDAPLAPSSHPYGLPSPSSPWKGRVYLGEAGRDAITAYFDPAAVLTYAFATVPLKIEGTDMAISGDKPIDFKSPGDAERWYAQNVSGKFKQFVIPHSVVASGGAFRLMLGPVDYGWLLLLCVEGKPSCHIIGQRP